MTLTMQPIDQQLQALNMDIACGVMNTVVIGDLQKVIENHNRDSKIRQMKSRFPAMNANIRLIINATFKITREQCTSSR